MLPTRLHTSRLSLTELTGIIMESFGSLDAGLGERSVNVASDEQLLIANLLDMDVANMLNGPCFLASCTSVAYNPSRVHRM